MSATATASADTQNLTEKQRQILSYLRDNADTQTYFKSRLIGEDLDLSAKEVGTNMTALEEQEVGLDIEKWGYSSSTTWMVTDGHSGS
jgi:DNA-binding Lrp family transcriptional regulator